MPKTVLIAELQARGVVLTAHEVVAIAQQLIRCEHDAPQPPFGPPLPHNVELVSDGTVICRACAVTPTVAEVGIFMQELLQAGTSAVPGGLRYAVARALHDVDAPPFDSLEEFSRTL